MWTLRLSSGDPNAIRCLGTAFDHVDQEGIPGNRRGRGGLLRAGRGFRKGMGGFPVA